MSGLDHRRREDADLGGGEDDSDGEELDPRVQQELEKLNACTEEINLLETQLEDANCLFRYYCDKRLTKVWDGSSLSCVGRRYR